MAQKVYLIHVSWITTFCVRKTTLSYNDKYNNPCLYIDKVLQMNVSQHFCLVRLKLSKKWKYYKCSCHVRIIMCKKLKCYYKHLYHFLLEFAKMKILYDPFTMVPFGLRKMKVLHFQIILNLNMNIWWHPLCSYCNVFLAPIAISTFGVKCAYYHWRLEGNLSKGWQGFCNT